MSSRASRRTACWACLGLLALSWPLAASCTLSEVFAGPFFNFLGFNAPQQPPPQSFLVVVQNRLSPGDPADLTLLPPQDATYSLVTAKSSGQGDNLDTLLTGTRGGEQDVFQFPCDVQTVTIQDVTVFEPLAGGGFNQVDVATEENATVQIGQTPGQFRCGDVVSFQILRRLTDDANGLGTEGGGGDTAGAGPAVSYIVGTEIVRR